MSVHLSRDGLWRSCRKHGSGCSLPFHVEMSPVEANALPEAFVEQLVAAVIPPSDQEVTSTLVWRDAQQLPHRDYGLPAVVDRFGTKIWYSHGLRHRRRDLPAVTDAFGRMEWWRYGVRHRDGDKPAILHRDGTAVWFSEGELLREGKLA